MLLPAFLFLAAAVPDALTDRFVPAPLQSQRIEGLLGDRMRVNLEGRLLHIDEPALLEGFVHAPGKQAWIGEHIGKYLDAGCRTWRYTRDARLKTQMDRMVRALIAAQKPDGYLGTYRDADRWTSWDVWVHKYNLLGLIAYYETFEYKPALDSARRIGDLLATTFGDRPGQRDIIASSTHVGMAATSVLEPVVYLYRDTGDKRYLDFARYILRAWEQPNGPRIVSSLRAHGSVFKTANSKAYEMMSDLVGLVEYARITGERDLAAVAETAWSDIQSRRLYITGTTSSHEHFQDDRVLPGEETAEVGEGCATVTWLQLTWQLLRLTGEARYAEELERTVYNQLLAAQDPVNGNICYFTPLDGRKKPTPGINCCVSSEPRGISLIPQLAWGVRDQGVVVNFYAPGRMKTKFGEIEVATTYPRQGAVQLKVAANGRFPLYLRVPAWTSSFTASVAGERATGRPGEYLTLDRQWKSGDTVTISIDLTVRVMPGAPAYNQSIAIVRGPEVLALEESLNPQVASLDTAGPRLPVHLREAGDGTYTAESQDGGTLKLVPFSAAQSYRVWLQNPPPAFRMQKIDGGLRGGYQVVVSDLNRDGKPDLIALSSGLDELVWYENPGWQKHVLARGLNRMINCAVAGDEIVVAHEFNNEASKSIGIVSVVGKDGSVREIDRLPTSHRLRLMNIDGKRVVVNAPLTGPDMSSTTPLVYYVPGEWKRMTIPSANIGVQHGIFVDGPTLWTASFSGIHRFQKTNGQWTRSEFARGDPSPCPKCGASDIARLSDGSLAAIEPWHGNQLVLYRGTARELLDDTLTDAHALEIADFDGDGRDEIVVAQRGAPGRVLIYRGRERIILDEGINAASCAAADFDGDGRTDLACIGSASQDLKVYWNRSGK